MSWLTFQFIDYMEELGENLDVVIVGRLRAPLATFIPNLWLIGDILGAYWGEGKRGGSHASYLCALRDDVAPLVNGQPR